MGQIESPLYPDYDVHTTYQQYRIISEVGTVIAVKIQRLLNRGGATLTVIHRDIGNFWEKNLKNHSLSFRTVLRWLRRSVHTISSVHC